MTRCTTILLWAALVLPACGGNDAVTTEGADGTEATEGTEVADAADSMRKATVAAEIAKEIRADPDAYDEILREKGMTPEQLEMLMYEIALDADLSDAYEAAL